MKKRAKQAEKNYPITSDHRNKAAINKNTITIFLFNSASINNCTI